MTSQKCVADASLLNQFLLAVLLENIKHTCIEQHFFFSVYFKSSSYCDIYLLICLIFEVSELPHINR